MDSVFDKLDQDVAEKVQMDSAAIAAAEKEIQTQPEETPVQE